MYGMNAESVERKSKITMLYACTVGVHAHIRTIVAVGIFSDFTSQEIPMKCMSRSIRSIWAIVFNFF